MTGDSGGDAAGRLNLHVFLSTIENESRLLKETRYTLEQGIFTRAVVLGLWAKGLKKQEVTSHGLEINRLAVLIRRYSDFWLLRRLPLLRKLVAALSMIQFSILVVFQTQRLKPSHVSCHNITLLPIAWAAARVSGARLVYVPHELETQRSGLGGAAQKVQALTEWAFIGAASGVVVVCEPIADWYRQAYGLDCIHVARNVPERDAVHVKKIPEGNFRERFGIPDDATVFIYQGLFGRARGVDRLLEIFSELPTERAHLVLMGYGDPPDEDMVRRNAEQHSNIHYQPAVPREWIISYTSGADIGIFIVETAPMSYRWSLPNKFFEYAHSGLPVLVSENLELLAAIVAEEDMGWSAPFSDMQCKIEALARTDIEPYRAQAKAYARAAVWEEDACVFKAVYST